MHPHTPGFIQALGEKKIMNISRSFENKTMYSHSIYSAKVGLHGWQDGQRWSVRQRSHASVADCLTISRTQALVLLERCVTLTVSTVEQFQELHLFFLLH